MVEDRGKKPKLSEAPEAEAEAIDAKLILSVEQLQEIQDELEKVPNFLVVFAFDRVAIWKKVESFLLKVQAPD